jgi:hypothetical protein
MSPIKLVSKRVMSLKFPRKAKCKGKHRLINLIPLKARVNLPLLNPQTMGLGSKNSGERRLAMSKLGRLKNKSLMSQRVLLGNFMNWNRTRIKCPYVVIRPREITLWILILHQLKISTWSLFFNLVSLLCLASASLVPLS